MNLIEQYIAHQRSRNLKKHTIYCIKSALYSFNIADILKPTQEEVLEKISLEKIPEHSSKSKYYDLKGFYKWVVEKGLLKENPLKHIDRPRPTKPKKVLTSEELEIEEFLTYVKASGYSKRTIKSERTNIKNFKREKFRHPTQNEILDFISEDGYHPKTLCGRYTTLNRFYSWLQDNNKIFINPMLKIKCPKVPKTLPSKIMTKGETFKLLEEAKEAPLRDRVILELLYTCSLRRMEVVGLNIEDVDFDNKLIKVRKTKNKIGRIIPVGEIATELLLEYTKDRQKGPIFLNFRDERLSANHVTKIASDMRKKSGIRTKATSHSLRKSSATHMLKEGAPLAAVQALLGHKQMKTTELYTKVYPADLLKMHRSFHPREREKNLNLPVL